MHEIPWFSIIMIRFKLCAMSMNGVHKWRSVAAVAVGEQEAEKWHQSNQSEISKNVGLNNKRSKIS